MTDPPVTPQYVASWTNVQICVFFRYRRFHLDVLHSLLIAVVCAAP